jgi:hypothetical protein
LSIPVAHFPFVLAVAATIVLGTTPTLALTAEQEAKLLPSDGAVEDLFSSSVAVDDDTAVIGARRDDDNGQDSGSAYVFTHTGGVWNEQAKLLPSDGAADHFFGLSVAVDGDTAVIGAPRDDDNGARSGSAYVFTRTGESWTEQSKLLPSDGADQDRFGWAVAVDGDTAVIGTRFDDDNGENSGSAYVFVRTGGMWTEQAKLLPSDGAAGDDFGQYVALDGDAAVIGAEEDDDNGDDSGSAYVFTRMGDVWSEQAKLLPSDGAAGDFFGTVAVDGDTVLIGAWADDDNGNGSGSAYVFTRTDAVWTEEAKLTASDGTALDGFGSSVALDRDTAVIGADTNDDNGINSGSAYVFTRTAGVWTQQAKLLAADGVTGDHFGFRVAVDGDEALIGALSDNDNGADSGSAYVFRFFDDDVPAVGGVGIAVLLLVVLSTGVYFVRRRTTT